MRFFRSLRNFFQPRPQEFQHPFSLTTEDIQHLSWLKGQDAWQVYIKVLDAVVQQHAEVLLASSDTYHDTLHKGTLLGIRRAATLVDEILLKEQEIARLRSQREAAAAGPPADTRNAALFGSPAWRQR